MSHGTDGVPYAGSGEDEAACKAYAEILQEVRIAQTAVQFLLGFLMAVAVTPRFAVLATADRAVYVTALVPAMSAAVLLVLSLVLSLSQAGLLAAVILCWLVGFWFAMPIWHRVRHTDLTPR
ncbi:DUF6328 family protein [Streptomyces sp. NPDC059918]|uniref:DUF6328 family protein n=1 Tax=unclassified Streptomyces TaxID=2593676 RepID=UPI00364EEE63